MPESIGIIGAGKVGSILALLLKETGYTISFIVSSSEEKRKVLSEATGALTFSQIVKDLPRADIILITTPDGVVADMAKKLVENHCLSPGTIVAHTSGSLSSQELHEVKSKDAFIASIHPLKSFTGNKVPGDFLNGVYFALEGDEESLQPLKELAISLGGKPFTIKTEQKIFYHAAAVVACNYLVSLNHYAVYLLNEAGVSEKEALNLLEPLIIGTLKNILTYGPVDSLTGPVERCDIKTLQSHLQEIEKLGSLEKSFYSILGLYTAKVAAEKNTDLRESYIKVKKLFEEAL
ncbi:MAG: hypothetical protein PWQ96_2442 [Clostridia bacterium]|nr:hypothetical protein [Clostridiales bacterium]MDK2986798.1 hypothetical protein [Clostridia bacterium]